MEHSHVFVLIVLISLIGIITPISAFECGVRTYAADVCLWPAGSELDGLNGGTASDVCELANENPLGTSTGFPSQNPVSHSACRDAIYADGDACITAYAKYICSKRCAACIQLVCAPVCTQLDAACPTALGLGCISGASCSDATSSCTNWNVNIDAIPDQPITTTTTGTTTTKATTITTTTTDTSTTSSASAAYVALWGVNLIAGLVTAF